MVFIPKTLPVRPRPQPPMRIRERLFTILLLERNRQILMFVYMGGTIGWGLNF